MQTDISQISILLYADDVVLIAESEDNLQTMLTALGQWSLKWKLNINQDKSKIVHFRKSNRQRSNYVFKVGNTVIDFAPMYKYLGVYFHENLNYEENVDILAQSASRALGSIVSKLKRNNFMAYSTYSKLYDSCVVPIADYASEIWGFRNFNMPNTLQNRAMRIFLGVHRFAPVAGLEGDMVWLSPQYRRWLNMIRFWNRLILMENERLTRKVFDWSYNESIHGCTNWCYDILSVFKELSMEFYFDNKLIVNIGECKSILKAKQNISWSTAVQNKPKLRFYAKFKDNLVVEKYTCLNLSSSERSVLAQLRFGILPLHVETGRFVNTKLEDRVCRICSNGSIEDECHFLFECSAYELPRNNWINSIVQVHPDFFSLELNDQLQCIFEHPRSTARFVKISLAIRKNHLYN